MFRHIDSVISVRVRISPTGDIITYKVILRKTGDRQTDDRKTANRKTGNKTGDKKILNKTDDIKTQKCSVIVIPSYQSPHCTYRRTLLCSK
jgi:hypothetical protein